MAYKKITDAFNERLTVEKNRGGFSRPEISERLKDYLYVLQQIDSYCIKKGYSVTYQFTSIYRDAAANEEAGGVSDSQHMKGDAGDYFVQGITREKYLVLAVELYPKLFTKIYEETATGLRMHTDIRNYADPRLLPPPAPVPEPVTLISNLVGSVSGNIEQTQTGTQQLSDKGKLVVLFLILFSLSLK